MRYRAEQVLVACWLAAAGLIAAAGILTRRIDSPALADAVRPR